MNEILVGIFVGGAGKRMGGVTKGMLLAPGGVETLLERLLRVCASAAPEATRCLVGSSSEFAELGLPQLRDDPQGVGPIGGLRSLLLYARAGNYRVALALACDLPFLDGAVISALLEPLVGAARVPVVEERLQPLAAAYAPEPTLAALERSLSAGKHALMHVLDELGDGLSQLELNGDEARSLRDWDTPEDMNH